jgi:cysteine desulfurase
VRQVYLDYNASTPVDPRVADAMRQLLADAFGNASSGYWAGAPARALVEEARSNVAALLRCRPGEVAFTSGGSEGNNLALKGVFFARRGAGDHIVTSQIEHPAILVSCGFLERQGARVTYLPVDRTTGIDPDDVRRALTPRTILVSVMHANNEVGTIQPIAEIARIARAEGVLARDLAPMAATRTLRPHERRRRRATGGLPLMSRRCIRSGLWSRPGFDARYARDRPKEDA